MEHRRFWQRTATSLAGQGLNLALGVAASIPIGRGLGAGGKGEFALYGWGASLAVVFLSGGWHSAVATVASGSDDDAPRAILAGRRRLLPAAQALLALALACAVSGAWGWCWAVVTALLQTWGQPASGALTGSGRLGTYYRGVLLQSGVLLGGLALLWAVRQLTPERAMAVSALAALCGTVAASHAARAGYLATASDPALGSRVRTLARESWLAELATFFTYRLDFLIVRLFTGFRGLGLYSTATALAELGRMAPNAIGQAALRELGRADAAGRAAVARRAALQGMGVSAGLLAVLAALAPWLIATLYGSDFAPAAPLVAWLAPGVACLALASVAASWLAVSGRAATTARLAWLGCGASVVLSVLLTLRLALTGAAVASSLGYVLLAATVWRAATRDTGR